MSSINPHSYYGLGEGLTRPRAGACRVLPYTWAHPLRRVRFPEVQGNRLQWGYSVYSRGLIIVGSDVGKRTHLHWLGCQGCDTSDDTVNEFGFDVSLRGRGLLGRGLEM